jgi:hypothetical protein
MSKPDLLSPTCVPGSTSGLRALILESDLTCPRCGFIKRETMSTDACQFLYECENCNTLLRPKPGDCCVFCSFGSVKCPPVQMHLSVVRSRCREA